VPLSRVHPFSTVQDRQATIRLDVRQGESPRGLDNLQLGTLDVAVPPRPRGEVTVNVRFTYDVNGLLEVEAHVPATGVTVQSVIQRNTDVMTSDQIEVALEKLRALKVHPRDKQENAYLVERAKRLYEDRLGNARQDIARVLGQFEAVLDSQDEHVIKQVRGEFRTYLDSIDKGFVL